MSLHALNENNSSGSGFQNYFFTFLLISVFSIPLSIELPFTDSFQLQVPLEIFVAVTAIFFITGLVTGKLKFRFSLNDFAVLLFLAAAFLSVIFSTIPLFSIKAFALLFAYTLVFFFGMKSLNGNSPRWRKIWQTLSTGFFILMIYTLIHYLQLGIHRQNSYEMSQPFIPGHTLLIAIGFPAYLMMLNDLLRKKTGWLMMVFITLFLIITLISFSRIYWVILFTFSFLLIFYHVQKARLAMISLATLFLITGIIAYFIIDQKRDRDRTWDDPDDHNSVFVQIQSIFVWYKNESNIERGNRWLIAREIYKDNKLTGSGLNTYPEIYFQYKEDLPIHETNLSCVKMNAHQLYFGWLSDMGLIGFISGLLMLSAWLITVIRLRGSPHFLLSVLLFLNFILLGLIEDFTTLDKIMAVFWISFAYTVHLGNLRD